MNRKKKAKPIQNQLVNDILALFAENPSQSFNYKQISAKLFANDKSNNQLLTILLADLVARDALKEVKKREVSN